MYFYFFLICFYFCTSCLEGLVEPLAGYRSRGIEQGSGETGVVEELVMDQEDLQINCFC